MEDNKKIFLIINLSFFGDVLLSNTLCQNIKREYPDSRIIFLVNTPFYEAAKYQKNVDDVICMNKRKEHRGLFGLLRFAFTCKYRNKIYAAFIIYGNSRGILVSYLLNSQKRISGPTKFVKHLLTDIWFETSGLTKMQDINGNFLKALTGKNSEILPIEYNVAPDKNFLAKKLLETYTGKNIIGLCCVSKEKEKDMPIETAIEIINRLNKEYKTVFLFGNGDIARKYADNLKKLGCTTFVDLTNVTSIYDLANIIATCKGIISVDTGTMHLSCAVKTPTVCLFYKKANVAKWAPNTKLYNVIIEDSNFTAETICKELNKLLSAIPDKIQETF